MPWAHGDDYMEQKNAELTHLLILRHLPHSGTKKKMAMRLTVHDDQQSVYAATDISTNTRQMLTSRTAPFRSRNSRQNFAT